MCGNEPKRDFALRGIIRLLYTIQGREEPTAASTNFDLGTFAQMYREEREQRRILDELRRQQAVIHQFPNVDMADDVTVVEDEGPNQQFTGGAQEGGEGDVEVIEVL